MRVLYLSFTIIIVDQVTKFLVKGISIPFLNINLEGMKYGQSFEVIGSFFKITFVENPGMAFGIDIGLGSKLFLSLFSLAASIAILVYMFKVKNRSLLLRFSLALILGGAIGNLIDRTFYGVFYDYAPVFYGKVVDFFNVEFFDFTLFGKTFERWPIFNIADAAVTIGVLILIIFHNKIESHEKSFEENKKLEFAGASNSMSVSTPGSKDKAEEHNEIDSVGKTKDVNSELENGENNNRKEI